MVVFVDVNTRQILFYEESGVRKIPFHDAHILTDIVGNKKVNYVTNVIETTAVEIVDLVRGISGQKPLTATQRVIEPDLTEAAQEASYLHSTSKGTLLVSDIGIRFDGYADCKIFNDDMKENVKNSSILRSLIKKGTVEIIGEQKKNELLQLWRQDMQKVVDQQSARDEALDDIIMDGPVGGWNGQIAGGDEVAIEIDVGRRGVSMRDSGAGSASHGASSMSELQSMIDGTM